MFFLSRVWRETIQVPDYILKRPSRAGDRFFRVSSEPNRGYVFRLRRLSLDDDDGMENDYLFSNWEHEGEAYRLECALKGNFSYSYDEDREFTRWICIGYHGGDPKSLLPILGSTDEVEIKRWVAKLVGKNEEITGEHLGKWSWPIDYSPLDFLNQRPEKSIEAWCALVEQQFGSLFALVVTEGLDSKLQSELESMFSGYRETSFIKSPLAAENRAFKFNTPDEWLQKSFWNPFLNLGNLGELAFDVWARDLDSWWLNTWRKKGLNLSLIPNQSLAFNLKFSDSPVDSATLETIGNTQPVQVALTSDEIRRMLMSNMERNQNVVLSEHSLHDRLYGGDSWDPIDDKASRSALDYLLDRIQFFDKAEEFLSRNDLGIALTPVESRTVCFPKTTLPPDLSNNTKNRK